MVPLMHKGHTTPVVLSKRDTSMRDERPVMTSPLVPMRVRDAVVLHFAGCSSGHEPGDWPSTDGLSQRDSEVLRNWRTPSLASSIVIRYLKTRHLVGFEHSKQNIR